MKSQSKIEAVASEFSNPFVEEQWKKECKLKHTIPFHIDADVILDPAVSNKDVSQMLREYEALNAVAEAAKPFERLKGSRSSCCDAYHIATDETGKRSIGQILTEALANLEAIRNAK